MTAWTPPLDAYYQVVIAINQGIGGSGGLEWTITHEPGDGVADDLIVLSSLEFGWSMPADALWPLQPNPMTCSGALNVPYFPDVEWFGEGISIAVEVKLHPDADVQFAFYGSCTDARAVPRNKREGVTLSWTAVDYTVDTPKALETWPPFFDDFGGDDGDALENVFTIGGAWGDMPAWPIIPTSVAVIAANQMDPRAYIDLILLGAVNVWNYDPSNTDLIRPLFAPRIDSDGLQPAAATGVKRWAFDLLFKHPRWAYTIPSSHIDRGGLSWARNKRTAPGWIRAMGYDGPAPPYGSAGLWSDAFLSGPEPTVIQTASTHGGRLDFVASIFLPDATPVRRAWTPTVRWMLSRETPAVLEALPLDFMPRWKEAELDLTRGSCYGRLITLDGVPDHVNPFADTADPEVIGLLTSCYLNISRGQVELELGFSHCQEP